MHWFAAANYDLRVVALALGGLTLGLSLFVLRLYRYATRIAHGVQGQRVPGALPYHVSAMAAAHLILTAAAMAMIGHRMLNDLPVVWWYLVPNAVAWVLSLVALVSVLKWEQTRIHRLLKPPKGDT